MDDREKPLNITLLLGGISAEREISLMTGRQIAEALRKLGHRVWESDIGPDNLAALDHRPCDLVFPALHGVFGEDGQLQQHLEDRGLPYVGSGPRASRAAMDKAQTKSRLLESGIPTPDWQIVQHYRFKDSWTPLAGIGYPCVIKPISEGSSVGCRICPDIKTAREHLEKFLPTYGAMLVEQFVEGYELTVGLLDGRTLPVIWIRPATPFYDYESKYFRDDTQYAFNIPLPDDVLTRVRAAAEATWRVIGARHLARVDIMVDKTTHKPYVLEINTMPGFTTHSLVPMAARHAGLDFGALCSHLAHLALRDAAVAAPK